MPRGPAWCLDGGVNIAYRLWTSDKLTDKRHEDLRPAGRCVAFTAGRERAALAQIYLHTVALPVWSRSVVVCVIDAIAHAGINVAVALLQADGLSTVIMGYGMFPSPVHLCPIPNHPLRPSTQDDG